jgi:hypothetical protein
MVAWASLLYDEDVVLYFSFLQRHCEGKCRRGREGSKVRSREQGPCILRPPRRTGNREANNNTGQSGLILTCEFTSSSLPSCKSFHLVRFLPELRDHRLPRHVSTCR